MFYLYIFIVVALIVWVSFLYFHKTYVSEKRSYLKQKRECLRFYSKVAAVFSTKISEKEVFDKIEESKHNVLYFFNMIENMQSTFMFLQSKDSVFNEIEREFVLDQEKWITNFPKEVIEKLKIWLYENKEALNISDYNLKNDISDMNKSTFSINLIKSIKNIENQTEKIKRVF